MKRLKNLVGAIAVASACALNSPKDAVAQERTNVWSTPSLDTNKLVDVQWLPQYSYNVSAGTGGSVSGISSGWYDSGTVVSNYAAPTNQHYVFDKWLNVPAGKENENPLVFPLTNAFPQVTATFKLRSYTVDVVSTHPWFGTNTIGNPSGAGSYPAGANVTVSVDTYVYNPTNQYMRLRAAGASVSNK